MDKTGRLTREDWMRAGFSALVAHGPSALKAEKLARKIGATKGSFYWHFKDVPDFKRAMLDYWRLRGFDDIADQIDAGSPPHQQLRHLGQVIAIAPDAAFGGRDIEPAMRAWAREDATVATAMAEMDQARLAYLEQVLAQVGLTNPDLRRLIYGAYVGLEQLGAQDGQDSGPAMETLIDLILALHEA